MNRLLESLHRNRVAAWAASGVYYVIVVTTHDLVQRPALRLQRNYGVELVHYIIAALLAVLLGWIVWTIRGRVKSHPRSARLVWSGVILLGWSLLVFTGLMTRSIEAIHYIQYLVLALALSAILRNPMVAVLLATVAGLLDEAWQYWYLRPNAPYFDWNDVVMNITGALQGVWLYAVFRPPGESGENRVGRTLAVWGGVVTLMVALLSTGVFTVYRHDSGIPLQRRDPPTAEKPARYVNTNKWGNTWIRLHTYVGLTAMVLVPLGILGFPKPLDRED